MPAWKKGGEVGIYHQNQSSFTPKMLKIKFKGLEFACLSVGLLQEPHTKVTQEPSSHETCKFCPHQLSVRSPYKTL